MACQVRTPSAHRKHADAFGAYSNGASLAEFHDLVSAICEMNHASQRRFTSRLPQAQTARRDPARNAQSTTQDTNTTRRPKRGGEARCRECVSHLVFAVERKNSGGAQRSGVARPEQMKDRNEATAPRRQLHRHANGSPRSMVSSTA
jgi:hypothetical protein